MAFNVEPTSPQPDKEQRPARPVHGTETGWSRRGNKGPCASGASHWWGAVGRRRRRRSLGLKWILAVVLSLKIVQNTRLWCAHTHTFLLLPIIHILLLALPSTLMLLHTHTHTRTQTGVNTHIHRQTHTHAQAGTQTHARTHARPHARAHTHIHTHRCVHTHILRLTHKRVHTHTLVGTQPHKTPLYLLFLMCQRLLIMRFLPDGNSRETDWRPTLNTIPPHTAPSLLPFLRDQG